MPNSSSSKKVDTVIIDADITAFQVCASAEVETEWDDDVWTLHSDWNRVRIDFGEAINAIQDITACSGVILAFTSKANFRKTVYPPYKSNRKKARRPMHLQRVREWARDHWEVHEYDGVEGDDVLGILATTEDTYGIYSADKDLKTVPAMLWSNDEQFFYPQAEPVADWWFMAQTLTGDTTDGYPGCPGIGPKRASDLLGEPGAAPIEELWPRVVKAYEAKGLTEEDALTQARCARILRKTDWNPLTGDPILWTPPKAS